MSEQVVADSTFAAVQSRLFGLAYRMLRSRAEAEDETTCRKIVHRARERVQLSAGFR